MSQIEFTQSRMNSETGISSFAAFSFHRASSAALTRSLIVVSSMWVQVRAVWVQVKRFVGTATTHVGTETVRLKPWTSCV